MEAFRPQNLQEACNVVSRAAKIKEDAGYGFKKAVQHDLVNSARKTLLKQGILEFEYDFTDSSDSEQQGMEEKTMKLREKTENSGSDTTCKRGGKTMGALLWTHVEKEKQDLSLTTM